ncbi:DUF4194 domain-containing protein [Shewanella algicola]|uniref:DUF4194 domain-containing protein n=1 Tax=Shewanella algicola TaxID=640633 RepID=UPI0024946A4F|nr:DUF4194 domain-containing protein [Shewanella algicola]
MSNNSPNNSFFSMVTGKKLTGKNEDIRVSDDDRSSDSDEVSGYENKGYESGSPAAEGSSGDELAHHEAGESAMSHDARRVLVHLMRQGSVIATQKSKLFELLCRHEMAIRKHLSEVYLQLVLDRKTGVAFIASSNSVYKNDRDNVNDDADAGTDVEGHEELEESITLISKRTLSLYDTLILLVLRKHYQDRESAGEQKITIDIERLESYLTPFLPITDHASKDRKKLLARVKEMVKRKVLSTIRGTEDRYEITPIIRYVVSASFLESMLAEYTALASDQSSLNDEGKQKLENGGPHA